MSFSWDQSASAPALDGQDDGDGEYVCGRCLREQHERCTERECTCCNGEP